MLKNDGKKVEKREVAHLINDFFINIGQVSSKGKTALGGSKSDTIWDEGLTEEGWGLDKFTIEEVLKVVREINVSKSSGLQTVSSFVIKEAFSVLAPQVTFMLNLSIETSTFPAAWKEALVIPIPKSGNLTQVQNYRKTSSQTV